MRILRPVASRTAQRQANHPAAPASERLAGRPGSPGSRRNEPPLPLPAGMRTQQPPQPGPHADQRLAVHEPLKILSLRLRKEQRIQDQALILLTYVVHAPTRPGHMHRQLHHARGRPFQVLQRRWHATRVLTPARRQSTSLHTGNYPPLRTSRAPGTPRHHSPHLTGPIAEPTGRSRIIPRPTPSSPRLPGTSRQVVAICVAAARILSAATTTGSNSTPDGRPTSSPTGTFQWTTPSGRQYVTEPTRYPS